MNQNPSKLPRFFHPCVILAATCLALAGCGADSDSDGISDARDRCPRTPAGRDVDSAGCCPFQNSFNYAVAAVSLDGTAEVGEIWMFRQLARLQPLPGLEKTAAERAPLMKGRFDEWLVNPEAPRILLPNPPGRGFARYMICSFSIVGDPPDLAARYLREFWSTDESGYILTHQLLFLELGLARNLPVAEELRARREVFLNRILAEQRASAPRFSDLYAERVAFLLMFGNPDRIEAGRWLDLIIRHQLGTGMWADPLPADLTYDGETTQTVNKPIHTTALCLAALGFFLHRHGVPEEPAADNPG